MYLTPNTFHSFAAYPDDSQKSCSNYVRAKHIDSSTECHISTFVTCSFSEVPLAFSFCKWAAFLSQTGDKSQR